MSKLQSEKVIAAILFGCFLNPINAQNISFPFERLTGFERNVRSMLDRGRDELKTPDRVEESTRQEVLVRQNSDSVKNSATVNNRDKSEIIDENNVHLIPRSDSSSAKEVASFNSKWKSRKFTFIGKKNRGGGLSMGAYYINGCDSALNGIKLDSIVSGSGNLLARESGGSGGEPLELNKCVVVGDDKLSAKANTDNSKNAKFGYLGDTSKIIQDGDGCVYYLAAEYKNANKKIIGQTSAEISGIVLNIEGKTILIKGRYDSNGGFLGSFGTSTLRIPSGKIKVDAQDGSTVIRTQFNLNASGAVSNTSVVANCHE